MTFRSRAIRAAAPVRRATIARRNACVSRDEVEKFGHLYYLLTHETARRDREAQAGDRAPRAPLLRRQLPRDRRLRVRSPDAAPRAAREGESGARHSGLSHAPRR